MITFGKSVLDWCRGAGDGVGQGNTRPIGGYGKGASRGSGVRHYDEGTYGRGVGTGWASVYYCGADAPVVEVG